ncbi:unnamed protein product, partial [Musa banksii]
GASDAVCKPGKLPFRDLEGPALCMQKAAGNQTRLQASYIGTQRTSHNTVCENSATLAT